MADNEKRADSAKAAALTVDASDADSRMSVADAPCEPAPARPHALWQKVAIAVVAAASVALIGVSGMAFFAPSANDDFSGAGLLQTTVELGEEADAPADDAETPSDEAKDDTDSSDGPSTEASADEDAVENAASGADVRGFGASAPVQDGAAVPPASNGSATQPDSELGESGAGAAPAPSPATVTVRVSVGSQAVGNPVSASGTYTFEQGATAYDALCALGLPVNVRDSAMGLYVAAIGGLAEKEHGGESGWKYSVNGADPQMSSAACALHDGDVVAWRYVTSLAG